MSAEAAIRTLAAMATLGEASTAQLCAYAGVRPDVATSVLRADPHLIAEIAATDHSQETIWRVRRRGELHTRMSGIRGPGPTSDTVVPDRSAGVMPSDVAVAEQICLKSHTTASDATRIVLAHTALHLVWRLQPHAQVRQWSARLTVLGSRTGASASPEASDAPDEADVVALRRRAGLVAVFATVVQALAEGCDISKPELDAMLRAVSAHCELDNSPVHGALIDLLAQIATRVAGAVTTPSDVVNQVRQIRQVAWDAPLAAGTPYPRPAVDPAPDPELLSLLDAYLAAPTWSESQRLVEQHPQLLSEAAEAAVQSMLNTMRERGELRMAAELERQTGPLRRAPVIGVQAAFAEMSGGDGLESLVMNFVCAVTWADSREILRRNPQLLDDVVLEGIASLVDLARGHREQAAAEQFTAHLDVLRRSREVGADAAFAELIGPDPDQPKTTGPWPGPSSEEGSLLPTLWEFLEAGTLAQMRNFAAEHPVLLGPEADEMLATLARQISKEGDAETALKLTECRRMLARLRSGGDWDAATDGADEPSPIPTELRQLMLRIIRLSADEQMEERADLLRQVIDAIDPEIHAELWASMRSMLGATLGDLAERDRSPHHYEEAIAALEAVQPHLERMPDSSSLPALVHHQLGMFYSRRVAGNMAENMDRAIGNLTAALSGASELPAHLRPETLCELAGLLLEHDGARRAQDIEDATGYAREALTLISRDESPAHWAVASRLLGGAYLERAVGVRRDNLVTALRHLHAAEDGVDAESDPAEWVLIQCCLGSAYREGALEAREESMKRAIQHFQCAVEVAERRLEPLRRAAALNGLGTAFLDRAAGDPSDNVEQAIDYFRRTLEICDSFELVAEGALVRRNLANAYFKRERGVIDDNLETSRALLGEALAVYAHHRAPYQHAVTLMTLASTLGWCGRGARAHNIEKAIDLFTEAANVFRQVGARRELATCQYNLASAHLRAMPDEPEHIASAIGCLESALTEFHAQGLVIEQARALDALGLAWSKLGSRMGESAVDTAIRYHASAIHVLGSPTVCPETWVTVQSNLGSAYVERRGDGEDRERDLDSAIACLHDSLAVGAGQRLGPTGGLTMTQTNLGIAYARRAERGHPDDLATAIAHLEAGFEAVTASGVSLQRKISGKALGDAYAQTGTRWADAVRAYREALAAADSLYVSALLRTEREAELGESPGLHTSAAYAAAMAGDAGQAVVWLERGRARSLGEAVARDLVQLDKIRSDFGALAAEFEEAARRVQEIDAEEWSTEVGGGGAMGVPGESVRWRRMQQARQRLEKAITAIRAVGHPTFLRQPELSDITSVAAEAGPIVYLSVAAGGSLTLLVTTDPAGYSPTVRLIPAPSQPLTAESLGVVLTQTRSGRVHRGYLSEQQGKGGGAGLAWALDELLPILGEKLVRPLADALRERGERCVTIVACGLLGPLPLHAARYERNGEQRTLLDDVDVSFAPSVRVLKAVRSRLSQLAPSSEPTLAGVGDPVGSEPLPFAAFETKEISRLFRHQRTFYQSEATKDALLAAAAGATHIHLACHGTFFANAPLDSALQLAGGSEPGPLTLREILTLRPFRDARLVVTSACRTAVIDVLELPDEVVGLPAGILRSGTPGVIGTLWPVDDLSTALLMIRFYECLFGADGHEAGRPAAALRSAQRWLARLTVAERDAIVGSHCRLQRDLAAVKAFPDAPWQHDVDRPGTRPYAHPYYWAPFVFVGA